VNLVGEQGEEIPLIIEPSLTLRLLAESEDLSSGDFSEPTTPNCKNFPQNEDDEVFQHYQLLVLKLDSEFKHKQRELERSSASNRSRDPLKPHKPNPRKC